MAGPWENYATQPPPADQVGGGAGPWGGYKGTAADAVPQPKTQPYSGGILPFSKDDQGHVSFDSNAGLLGSIKRAFTLPADVMQGRVDPKSDEGIGRALEMATVVSPSTPALKAGDKAVPGMRTYFEKGKVTPPTAEQLSEAAAAGYQRFRDMGVDYSSNAIRGLSGSLRADLEKDGILAELAPKTFQILGKLENPPPGSVASGAGIEAARRAFGLAARDFTNPTEQMAAQRVVGGLDKFVEAADPSTVVAGPAAAAGKTLADARGNYAASKRSAQLAGVEEAADLRAAAANSGQNTDNAIRSRIASLLLDPKKSAGYSEEELSALEGVVRGNGPRNVARALGNAMGGGGGLMTGVAGAIGGMAGGHLGGETGALIGAGVPAVGFGAKKLANALTSRALGSADELVRTRSPLYDALLADAPLVAAKSDREMALIKALMAAQEARGAQQ